MRKRGNFRVFDEVMNRILDLRSELRVDGETRLGKYGAPEKSPSNPYEIRDPIMIIFCAAGNEDNPMRTRESLYSALGKKRPLCLCTQRGKVCKAAWNQGSLP